jgi:hypothetical protein
MRPISIRHFVERGDASLLWNGLFAFLPLLLEDLHSHNSLWYGADAMQQDSSGRLSLNQTDLSIVGAISEPQPSYPAVALIKDLMELVCFAFHWVSFVLLFAKVKQLASARFEDILLSSANKRLAG